MLALLITFEVTLLIMTVGHGNAQCQSQETTCYDDGAVRLANGALQNEGRVEMFVSGQWKTVCDDHWSMTEAQVVCRQLGYTSQGAIPRTHAAYGQGSGMIVERLRCNGTERRLRDCAIRDDADGLCRHYEDAGVQCCSSCRSGDVHLQGYRGFHQLQGKGRVEVCVNNVWGTVCDNSWSTEDASVVCRQLGFSRFGAQPLCCSRYGRGSGPIHMNHVMCVGNESALTDCIHTEQHNCHHGEDASVRCQTTIVCHDGDVRLVNGNRPHEGRVEVCFNETWGTVCSHINPNIFGWNTSEANVVCSKLGYSEAYASTFQFGRGSTPILTSYISCRGSESSLAGCTVTMASSTSICHPGAVGVVCRSDYRQNGDIRLTNGRTRFEGKVEIFWNSKWRAVCSEGWDEHDARVVCRQLNYLSAAKDIEVISFDEHEFKTKGVPVLLTDVGCRGNESHLTECCSTNVSFAVSFHCPSASGRRKTYAGVRCIQCTELQVTIHLESTLIINSTATLLNWRTSGVSNNACMTGILLRYRVEIIEDITGAVTIYTTEDTHLLLTSLRPDHMYTVRVATLINNEIGSYSQPVTITTVTIVVEHTSEQSTDQYYHFSSEQSIISSEHLSDQLPLISSLASLLGLVFVALIAAVSVAFYLYCKARMKTPAVATARPRLEQIPGPVYEMVDLQVPTKGDCDATELDSSSSPYTHNPNQAVQEYATPMAIASNQRVISFDNKGGAAFQARCVPTAEREDNTYQPLLPPRMATGPSNTEGDYQPLTRHTLPRGPNVTAPALPPKPRAK